MLKEILTTVKHIHTRPLLIAFTALSIVLIPTNHNQPFLKEIFGWHIVFLVIGTVFAYLIIIMWDMFLVWLNNTLSPDDGWHWSLAVGCILLVLCLHSTFTYFGNEPDAFSLRLLAKREFIWLITGYIYSLDAIKTPR